MSTIPTRSSRRLFLFPRLIASPVLADEPVAKLQTLHDSRGWEAAGRPVVGDRGFCTGALIAPQLLLPVAHCLFD